MSRILSEGSPSGPLGPDSLYSHPAFTKPVSRRGALGEGLRQLFRSEPVQQTLGLIGDVSRFSAAVAAGIFIIRDLKVPERVLDYLRGSNSTVTLIPGYHTTPDEIPLVRGILEGQQTSGSVNESTWPISIQQEMDRRMRARKGKDYYVAVDNVFDVLKWEGIPHPLDLTDQDAYPKTISVIGAEGLANFDVGQDLLLHEGTLAQQDAANNLATEVAGWYNENSSQNASAINRQQIEAVGVAIGEVLVARELLAPLIPVGKRGGRREFLGTAALSIFWTTALLKVAGNTEIFGALAGMVGNEDAQRFLASLQNTTGVSYGSDRFLSYIVGRTALAIEKAQDISHQRGNVPVDLLYGSGHVEGVPGLLSSHNLRIDAIKGFMRQHALSLREAIQTRYPILKPYLNQMLYLSLKSMAYYGITPVPVPWRQNTVPADFSTQAEKYRTISYTQSIVTAGEEVLGELGINITPQLKSLAPILPQ